MSFPYNISSISVGIFRILPLSHISVSYRYLIYQLLSGYYRYLIYPFLTPFPYNTAPILGFIGVFHIISLIMRCTATCSCASACVTQYQFGWFCLSTSPICPLRARNLPISLVLFWTKGSPCIHLSPHQLPCVPEMSVSWQGLGEDVCYVFFGIHIFKGTLPFIRLKP